MRLQYQVEAFQEARMGDRIVSSSSIRQVLVFAAGEMNRGLLPLRISLDGVALADAYLDQTGKLQDLALLVAQLTSDDAEALEAMARQLADDPFTRALEATELELNRPVSLDFSMKEILGRSITLVSPTVLGLQISVEYAGQRILGAQRAIEVRASGRMSGGRVPRIRARGHAEEVDVRSVELSHVTWYDPTKHIGLGYHQITIIGLSVKRRAVTMKTVVSGTLDRSRSRGL